MLVVWDLERHDAVPADVPPSLDHVAAVPDPTSVPVPSATPHVVWNGAERRLRAVRDRIGLISIFYTTRGQSLLISDRVATLLAALPDTPRINLRSVVRHLSGAAAPFPGETFFEGINEVPPGHVMTVADGQTRLEAYWSLGRVPPLLLSSDEEYEEAFRAILFEVIPQYLPAGEFALTLSSGLDSTMVAAAIAAAGRGDDTVAVTWAMPELPEADETADAKVACRRLGLRFHPVPVDHLWPLCESDSLRPSPDSPIHNIYTEAWAGTFDQMHQSGLGHALTGVSGDHLFGLGVYGHADLLLTLRWFRLSRRIRTDIEEIGIPLRRLVRRHLLGPLVHAYLRGRRNPAGTPPDWVLDPTGDTLTWRESSDRAWMLPGRWQRHQVLGHPALPWYAGVLKWQAAVHEIELRHPLLDHRLVEFAASLPATQTALGFREKWLVRRAMRGRIPDVILDRRVRPTPIALVHRGLREKEQAKVWHLLDDMRAADLGVVDPKRLRSHYQAYLDGDSRDLRFWNALTLEAWLRELP